MVPHTVYPTVDTNNTAIRSVDDTTYYDATQYIYQLQRSWPLYDPEEIYYQNLKWFHEYVEKKLREWQDSMLNLCPIKSSRFIPRITNSLLCRWNK